MDVAIFDASPSLNACEQALDSGTVQLYAVAVALKFSIDPPVTTFLTKNWYQVFCP